MWSTTAINMLSLASDMFVELPMDGNDMQNGCPSGACLESPEVLYERQHGLIAFGTFGKVTREQSQ